MWPARTWMTEPVELADFPGLNEITTIIVNQFRDYLRYDSLFD